jgi:hypothetical protein
MTDVNNEGLYATTGSFSWRENFAQVVRLHPKHVQKERYNAVGWRLGGAQY